MALFSLTDPGDGRPIAIIQGGELDNNIIYFCPSRDGDRESIKLTEGKIQQIPNIDPSQRDIFIIAGGSGLGKSTSAAMLMQQYQALFPDRKLFIFSKVKKDPSIDKLGLKNLHRILLDSSYMEDEEQIDSEDFSQCCILFDDVGTLTGKLKKSVMELRDDMMQTGRHNEITLICTYHLLMNKEETKNALLEGTSFQVWPQSNTKQVITLLVTYFGTATSDARALCSMETRSMIIIRCLPNIVMTDREVFRLPTYSIDKSIKPKEEEPTPAARLASLQAAQAKKPTKKVKSSADLN